MCKTRFGALVGSDASKDSKVLFLGQAGLVPERLHADGHYVRGELFRGGDSPRRARTLLGGKIKQKGEKFHRNFKKACVHNRLR